MVTNTTRCVHKLDPFECGQEKCLKIGLAIQRELARERAKEAVTHRRCKLCFTRAMGPVNVPHTHNSAGGVVTKVQPVGTVISIFSDLKGIGLTLNADWYVQCFGEENPWSQWLLKQSAA